MSKHFTIPRSWADSWEQRKLWERDTRFGTWNVKSLYMASFLTTVARGLVRFRLDLVGVDLVRWEKRDTVLAED